MKKVVVFLFLVCFMAFSANAITPPQDTSAAALSPNCVDWGGWSASQFRSTIDTAGGFAILNPDSSVAEIKAHVTTTKATSTIYPWVSIDCDLDPGKNLTGVTAIRITYKADKAWYLALYDSTLDPDNSGSYQAVMPIAAAFTTAYYNVFDTSFTYKSDVTFTQPDWVETAYRAPLNYDKINGLSFAPNDDAGAGVESTIEISDLRLYHYSGFTNPVRYLVKNQNHVLGNISLARSNILKFSVPQNNIYAVSIYSSSGKLVLQMSKPCVKDGNNEIALKNFTVAPGVYIARISQVNYSAIGKIIVK